MLHMLGRAYGRPPSEWVGGLSELERLNLDVAALRVGGEREREQAAQMNPKAANWPKGLRKVY